MAIPILNHMDFQKCGEIRNVLLHATGSGDVSGPGTGQIIYDSGTIKFYNGSGWVSLGTGSGSGTVTSVAITGTDGIDVDSGSPITTSGTITLGLSSIANAKLANSAVTLGQGAGMAAMGSVSLGGSVTVAVDGVLEDLDTLGAAASDGQVIVATGSGAFAYESGATLRTSIGVDAAGTDNSTAVTLATVSGNYLSLSGQAITAGTVPLTLGGTGATSAGAARTALGVDAAGTDNSTNVTLVTSSHDYLSISGQAITLGPIANNDLSNSSITVDGSAISLGGSVTTLQLGTSGSTALAGNTAVDNVSIANLKTKLAGGFGSNAVTIGDSDDVVTIGNDLIITGDLTVSGDTVTTNTATLSVEDPLIKLATGNTSSDLVDIGLFGTYNNGATQLYAGLFRDASDSGKWHLYDSSQTDPGTGTTVNTSATGHATATLKASIEGNLTGNVTGTILTASQTNITAVGTIATGVWQGTAIASGYIAADAITGAKIADDAIDSEHYVDGSIDHVHLAGDAVDGDNIANDSVNSEHYVDGSIDTAHIADDQVTYAKIQNVSATNRILGRDSSGAGVIEEITPANVVTMLGVAAGATANTAASAAEVQAGTNTTKFVTPDTLAAKSVVALIETANIDSTELSAVINHGLSTYNLHVTAQYKSSTPEYENVILDWECSSDGSAHSNDHIYVKFAVAPTYDIQVAITSVEGGTAVTATYPS